MNIKTYIMSAIGILLLILGVIGVVIPVWPTTPFVLCAVGCFAGNPKLRNAVLKIGFFREYYENYQNRNGLSKKTVIKSLSFLWIMLIISCIFTQKIWVTVILFIVGVCVTAHILYMANYWSGAKNKSN